MSANANGNATSNKAETAVAYAALILADEGIPITSDKLQTLLEIANVDIEPIWATLFAKALEGKDVKDILTTVSTSTWEVEHQQPVVDEGGDGVCGDDIKDSGDGDDGSDDGDMGGGMFDLFG